MKPTRRPLPHPRIRVGSAPDSWGVWFPEDSHQPPWERFLDELAGAGYEWLELGPHGYLPTDPVRLRDELSRRALQVSGGGVSGSLHREATWKQDRSDTAQVASLVRAVGGRYLIYLPAQYRDLSGNFTDVRLLEPEDWKRLTRRVGELGRMVADQYGLRLVFHPHADSHVASQDQVERFLADTDPAAVSLCLDTGHIAYCGGDNLDLIARFADRIGYVHLKQVDPRILARVTAEDLCFAEAVRRHAMCEPPGGVPHFGPLLEALAGLEVDLFAIVEQDLYPCDADRPQPIASRTRAYLGTCGR